LSRLFWVLPGEDDDERQYKYEDDGDADWRHYPQRVHSLIG